MPILIEKWYALIQLDKQTIQFYQLSLRVKHSKEREKMISIFDVFGMTPVWTNKNTN